MTRYYRLVAGRDDNNFVTFYVRENEDFAYCFEGILELYPFYKAIVETIYPDHNVIRRGSIIGDTVIWNY